MKPSQIAAKLRAIASYIEKTPNPSQTKVASAIKSVVASMKTASPADPTAPVFYVTPKAEIDEPLGLAVIPWGENNTHLYDSAPVMSVADAFKKVQGKPIALTDMRFDDVEHITAERVTEQLLQDWVYRFED